MKNNELDVPLTLEVREVLREAAQNIVEILLLEEEPFRIVMWNKNNWNSALPDSVMKAFPTQIVLDIKEMALEESYVDESTGEIIITTMFEGHEYQKVLEHGEIIAVLDLTGQPMILNNFKPEVSDNDIIKEFFEPNIPTTKAEIIELSISDGVPEEAANKSFDMFMKNNPELRKRFTDVK